MLHKYLFSLLPLCLLLTAAGCKDPGHNGASQPLPVAQVRVITVAGQAAQRQKEVAGAVESLQRATIGAKISGPIEEMPVELGSAVKKGALLARISAGEIAARLSQAETQFGQAQRNLDREKRLLAQDASTRETVKSLEDAYRMAEAGLREARAMRDYTLITAPFAGIISQKMANAGDLATPGMPLLVLENTGQLQVVAAVPEGAALKIKKGDALAVTVPAAEFSQTGTVSEIGPSADTASRTALVKIRVHGGDSLRPGQYARVALPGGDGVNTLLVPETALFRFGQMERIFVIHNNTAQLRLVRSGEHREGQAEILTGLNGGEQVVIQGGERLVDGQPVTIVP
ncbi:MAG: efflux RND transporter periplasmic adaptor subunit [Deltaproteobacteria bacterium HGW-Deltaproteobacteria-3]|nr:MAG: efflux RND transporter periplasmic adaptor subunit [Deltaproteobacteria bacterium HGW-Deltaproteobacteria-3]